MPMSDFIHDPTSPAILTPMTDRQAAILDATENLGESKTREALLNKVGDSCSFLTLASEFPLVPKYLPDIVTH